MTTRRQPRKPPTIRVNIYVTREEQDLFELLIDLRKGKARTNRLKALIRQGIAAEVLIEHGRQQERAKQAGTVVMNGVADNATTQAVEADGATNLKPADITNALNLDWKD